jgi:putative transposase
MRSQGFGLIAHVFMPEHVHLLVYPTTAAPRLDLLLKAIKRPFSFRVKGALSANGDGFLESLTVRERPGIVRFRFWQEGGGYDRNLGSEAAVVAAIEYIHLNPVRRGLCERAVDWRWSSATAYYLGRDVDGGHPPYVHGLPPDFFTSNRA